MAGQLLSVKEAAERLGVTVAWFYGSKQYPSAAHKAGIPVLRIGGYLRVPQDALESYIEEANRGF